MGLQVGDVELKGLMVMGRDSEVQVAGLGDRARGAGGPICHVKADRSLELVSW